MNKQLEIDLEPLYTEDLARNWPIDLVGRRSLGNNNEMAIREPRIIALEKYLNEERVLMVPDYQRDYTWGTGDREDNNQVCQLLEDLDAFVQSKDEEYLLGLVTLAETSLQVDETDIRHIVDGQQRTVTLSIFLMCVYEYIRRPAVSKKIASQAKLSPTELSLFHIRILQLFSLLDGARQIRGQRIKFTQLDSNLILQKIHNWCFSPIKDSEAKLELLKHEDEEKKGYLDLTMENLLDAREYFTDQLASGNWFNDDLYVAINKILSGVKLLELEISSGTEALAIYDRMNNRGMALNSADLIKNQLFVHVPNGKTYEDISTAWSALTKSLRGHGPKKFQDPEFMVKCHASMLWGASVRESELAKRYQDYFKGSNRPKVPDGDLDALAFINRLTSYADKTVVMCSDSELGNPLVYAARFLGAVQHFPLLLAAASIKNFGAQTHFLNQVGARALLQVLSKEHPPHVESIYPAWANAVHAKGENISIEELNSIYDRYAFARGGVDEARLKKPEFLKDIESYKAERFNELLLQVDLWKYDSSNKRKIRATLALVSWWLDKKLDSTNPFHIWNYLTLRTLESELTEKDKKEIAGLQKAKVIKNIKWDIDHILANKYEGISLESELRNSIGNLVLLDQKANKTISNKSPKDRIDFYRDRTTLSFTKLTTSESVKSFKNDIDNNLYSLKLPTIGWDLGNWGKSLVIQRQDFIKESLKAILLGK